MRALGATRAIPRERGRLQPLETARHRTGRTFRKYPTQNSEGKRGPLLLRHQWWHPWHAPCAGPQPNATTCTDWHSSPLRRMVRLDEICLNAQGRAPSPHRCAGLRRSQGPPPRDIHRVLALPVMSVRRARVTVPGGVRHLEADAAAGRPSSDRVMRATGTETMWRRSHRWRPGQIHTLCSTAKHGHGCQAAGVCRRSRRSRAHCTPEKGFRRQILRRG